MNTTFHDEAKALTDPARAGRLAQSFHGSSRLTGLLKRFSSVKAGARLLDMAQQHGLVIAFSDQLPPDRAGEFGHKGIAINRKSDDDENLATLAHELRHFQQECDRLSMIKTRAGARVESFPLRDPKTFFYLVRLREADAMASEAAFIRDYTDATGDTKPAEKLMRRHPEIYDAYRTALAENQGDRDEAHRVAFRAFFDKTCARYDVQTLDILDRVLDEQKDIRERNTDDTRNFMARKSPLALDAATLKRFSPEAAGEDFWRQTDAATLARLDGLAHRYAAFFAPHPQKPAGPRP